MSVCLILFHLIISEDNERRFHLAVSEVFEVGSPLQLCILRSRGEIALVVGQPRQHSHITRMCSKTYESSGKQS